MADMQTTIKMQARGVLTLPKKLRTRMRLDTGSIVRVDERDGGLFISTQSHLDPELIDAIRSGLNDLKNGNTIGPFASAEEYEAFRKARKIKNLKRA